MISCPICGFTGQPYKEHRTEETLLSCPHCGVLISTTVKTPLLRPQAREVIQNAA